MSSKSPRITAPTLKVLGELMNAPLEGLSGADISKTARIPSGTLYPILLRLEKAGWLSSEWEEGNPSEMCRPRKRLYSVTAKGVQEGRTAFESVMPSGGRFVWEV